MAQDVRLRDTDIEEDNISWNDDYIGSGDEASEKPNITYENTVDAALEALHTSFNNVEGHSLSTSGISSTEQVDKQVDINDEPLDVEDDGDSEPNRFSSWLPLEYYREDNVLPREIDIDKEENDEDELWFVFDQKEDKAKKALEDEKAEKQLRKKVADLTSQVSTLDKKVRDLKCENESLRKLANEVKPAEDKIQKLRKRNSELAAISRKLEDKSKHLQKQMRSRDGASSTAHDPKDMSEKEKEIVALKKKLYELNSILSNSQPNLQVSYLIDLK
ncbi:DgyrCDS9625 [Dimorphilus gyrociliatus]|uniref:DgyrCDS9625 n=1 Tax=Dimorphilus gyrociliatus TaxID=2664684 RepID=A0A7I8VXX0_9ANNE|nr:DgyrCDS9625 [Dimorphilus gyrociliatus]